MRKVGNGHDQRHPSFGSERAAAERAVAGLTGVRNVRDDIDISYDADQVDVDLHIQEALRRSALVPDDSDVEVAVKGSTIALTGRVRTWAEHDAVVHAAWMARGVVDVPDDLVIAAAEGSAAPGDTLDRARPGVRGAGRARGLAAVSWAPIPLSPGEPAAGPRA